MDPSNQQFSTQPQDFSIDYLNQISAPPPAHKPVGKIVYIMAGVILFFTIIVVIGLATSSSGSSKSITEKTTELYMRLETLRDVSKEQQDSLRSNKLRGYNSSLTLFLSNSMSSLEPVLSAGGTDAKKLTSSKTYKADQEALTTELTDKFQEAALNVRLDRAYAIEMAYQIDVVQSLITAIQKKNKTSKMQEFVDNNVANLTAISKEFQQFSGS